MRLTDELLARGIRPTVDRHALRRGQGAPSRVTVDTTEPMPGGDLLGVAMFGPVPAAVAVTSSGRVWVLTGGETGKVVVEEGAPEDTVEAVVAAVQALVPEDAGTPAGDTPQDVEEAPLVEALTVEADEAPPAGKRRRKQASVEADEAVQEDAGATVEP